MGSFDALVDVSDSALRKIVNGDGGVEAHEVLSLLCFGRGSGLGLLGPWLLVLLKLFLLIALAVMSYPDRGIVALR